jgi:hypothetical protein
MRALSSILWCSVQSEIEKREEWSRRACRCHPLIGGLLPALFAEREGQLPGSFVPLHARPRERIWSRCMPAFLRVSEKGAACCRLLVG